MAYIGASPTAVPLTGADIEDGTVQIADLAATGTKDATTFLRGDGTFASAGGANTPAFQATLSANQSVSDASVTVVQFNTETFDTDSCYDTGTYRFTPTTAGKYFIYAQTGLGSATASTNVRSKCYLYKNASGYLESEFKSANNNTEDSTPSVSAIVDMNGTTDYVEVRVFCDLSSGTPSVDNALSIFGGYKIIE